MRYLKPLFLFLISFYCASLQASNNWSGSIEAEFQGFRHPGVNKEQKQRYSSLAFKPEYSYEWGSGQYQLQFSAFARINSNNENRNRIDMRELYWSYASDNWELRAGIRKVFWGVTESQHLVDIINQTDVMEGFDGEEKLGQPMINFAYIQDWGTLDFFILPGFRERSFPDTDARLRPGFVIGNTNATYDSSQKEKHIDLAVRYSHYIGDWDFGLSHFYGTSREPRYLLTPQPTPHYDIIQQTGLDVQATLENWLWKLEAIHRSGMAGRYFAATFGLEYSFFDLHSSGVDLGLVAEYLYDERQDRASTLFEDDTLLAIRIALNDEQSTEGLFGIIVDNEGDGNIISLEANRRLGESVKINVEAYLFFDATPNDPLYFLGSEDYIQLSLTYFY